MSPCCSVYTGRYVQFDAVAPITVATSKTQVSAICNQLGDNVSISVEPCRRDTFPAIVLAICYLHDVLKISAEETVVICPVDPYVENEYFAALEELSKLAEQEETGLVLLGITPTYPSEKYGYILPETDADVSKVNTFKEKPDAQVAAEYISQGALWNGGVFACKLKYVLEKAHALLDFTDYYDLYAKYETLAKISFDYAVVEQEKNIKVKRFNGSWKDLGTWNTLTEAMEEQAIGQAIMNEQCQNLHVLNELDVPVLCMGLKDMVVAASPDGILVAEKEQSSYIKPFVDAIDQQVMFAEKSWGSFRVLDVGENSLTIKVTLKAGNKMNYHSHERRDEVWTIISGNGRTIVDGMEEQVTAGDVITMQAGCRHTIIADSELEVMEVQLGREISVHDKQKFELEE